MKNNINNNRIKVTNIQLENPDLVILNANELISINSKYGVPRIKEMMKELDIIHNGAISVKDGIITFVGTTKDLKSKINIDRVHSVIDAKDMIISPGFVDAHSHIIFEGSREEELSMKLAGKSYLEILESGGGILKTVNSTRNASIESLVKNGKKILDRMMKYGTTTVETKSGYGLSLDSEIKSLKAIKILNKEHPLDIVSTFLGAHAIPPEYKGNTDGYVNIINQEMIPFIADNNLAEFCDVFCEKGFFSIEQTKKILFTAINYGLKPQIHVDEIYDTNGALLAAELNAIQTGHLLKSNENGLKAMAKSGVIATLLPSTPLCLMIDEYAPARKMIDLGIPIALGTDLNPNCWTESMQMIIALACYNMKISPAEALVAATINSASALQKQDQIGSLEIGKKADIIIIDVPNHQYLPYHFGVNLISKVIKNGKIIVDRS